MLAIRLQRTGRKGHAQFRVVVQDSRRTPDSGRVVAYLGNYNPHTKDKSIDTKKAAYYLEHGAQPSERVAKLLAIEGVKLPKWVTASTEKSRTTKHPEKFRSTRPTEPAAEAEAPAAPEAETVPETDEASAETEPAAEEAASATEAASTDAEPAAAEAAEAEYAPKANEAAAADDANDKPASE
jgi:small subunit ribosomal protein S16